MDMATMTLTCTKRSSRFDWHPTDAEVEAIVEEMRPVIAALAAEQCRRLELVSV
jgi:hypothetical protein